MRLIDRVIRLLGEKKEPMTNEDLYAAMPEYSKTGIRGVISRYLSTTQEPAFTRTSNGVYVIIEVVKAEATEDGKTKLSYVATCETNGKSVMFFHKDFLTDSNVVNGIYRKETSFEDVGALMESTATLRGILAHADSRDILAKLKSESFSLILTDPPYKVISGGKNGKGAPKGMLSKNDGKIFDYNDISFDEYIPDCYRILKDRSHAYFFTNFINLQPLMEAVQKAGFKIHNLLAWVKNNATPNRWYMKNGEYVLLCYKGKAKSINNCGSKTFHQFDNILGSKIHETEKPVELLRYYIENSTQPGEWICDPFGGSGSTAVAAIISGRRCFTSEIDEKYIPKIYRRIKGLLAYGTDDRAEEPVQLAMEAI